MFCFMQKFSHLDDASCSLHLLPVSPFDEIFHCIRSFFGGSTFHILRWVCYQVLQFLVEQASWPSGG